MHDRTTCTDPHCEQCAAEVYGLPRKRHNTKKITCAGCGKQYPERALRSLKFNMPGRVEDCGLLCRSCNKRVFEAKLAERKAELEQAKKVAREKVAELKRQAAKAKAAEDEHLETELLVRDTMDEIRWRSEHDPRFQKAAGLKVTPRMPKKTGQVNKNGLPILR
jgi:hypothetical protein